ncbi:MAG: hypothetical protein G01um101448_193 [Parcubacteria group bacterium Gr01-1014_48]|nr:MAG: hypothetical protein Greene041614_944 [Parcubacteria group bacterium Greene0416_14]TSC74317.1 MAG: hypothetical protein G01um101448_193 [Parcubacteria group bacterium Gr01-1014_48]TSD01017.1 MAG: hypothetical protein Greene101415_518 [Parcubacteria group bacterium Greene1014_15]TSD07678.1 MAG: hypothetical protein Greene07144_832 [Parcubacteria group bacterium Greene0714_4]
MSGHNKWSKIKHKKAASDAKKSKGFSKIVRLLTVEAKAALGNRSAPNLKAAIEKARSVNMPSDTVERAIKKGESADASQMTAITYEAYGPGGVAIVIETLTENRNKTAAEIKHILSKRGLSLAGIGAASWAFQKEGVSWIPKITIEVNDTDLKQIAGIVEDLEDNDEVQEVFINAA